jgi:hypothetical protein
LAAVPDTRAGASESASAVRMTANFDARDRVTPSETRAEEGADFVIDVLPMYVMRPAIVAS